MHPLSAILRKESTGLRVDHHWQKQHIQILHWVSKQWQSSISFHGSSSHCHWLPLSGNFIGNLSILFDISIAKIAQRQEMFIDPLSDGTRCCDITFQLFVFDYGAKLSIDKQHSARHQTTLRDLGTKINKWKNTLINKYKIKDRIVFKPLHFGTDVNKICKYLFHL